MQSAETVLGVILTTGERYALKGARTVREGADGKGPEPRAPRRRPTSLGGGPGAVMRPTYPTLKPGDTPTK